MLKLLLLFTLARRKAIFMFGGDNLVDIPKEI